MAVPRDCTHNSRDIICQRHGGNHDTSASIQILSENDAVPGFTFGSGVQITRLTMDLIFFYNEWVRVNLFNVQILQFSKKEPLHQLPKN
jgi:hypothetical protein